jgi:uncharacterized membrane protein
LSYIDAHDVLTLTAVIAALTWFGFLMDASRLGKVMPGVACILLAGVVLSNLHITPFSSGVADFVGQYVVAAAIPLLMIKADLKKIFLESGRVMIGFAAACVGIVSGALLGYLLMHPWHVTAKITGMMTGAFVGGTISMLAVANAVQMSPGELSMSMGASMIPSVLGLMALVALPNLRLIKRHFPAPAEERTEEGAAQLAAASAVPPFRLTHISGALALSFSICAAAKGVEALILKFTGHDQGQYHILYVTTLTIIVANLFPVRLRALRGEFELGMIFMYMFFAIIGMGTNVTAFLDGAVSTFFYVLLLLAIGIVVTLLLARLLKLDMAEAITGLGAAIVGPAATVAVVAGKGWHSMISPAVMTGIFCHIAGNFIGITVATFLG